MRFVKRSITLLSLISFRNQNSLSVSNYKSLKAFTLAEVLVTLGIIGLVAAITLPTLVNKYQKKTYVTGLQKFYTQISQVMVSMKHQTSCEDMSCMGFEGSINSAWVENATKLFQENYHILKFCYGTSTCEYEAFFINGTSSGKIFTANEFSFKTTDGFIIKLMPWNDNWSSLTVDVNGSKNPNVIGRDIHLFRINKQGEVHPYYGYKYAQTQDGVLTLTYIGKLIPIYVILKAPHQMDLTAVQLKL